MLKSGQLKRLPNTPGVYLFKHGREILYVGKATSLKNRVRSYFGRQLAETRGEWLVKMVDEATRIETRVTDSVLEAIVLEAALIKKYQPKYNAKEKSDKSFNFVTITDEEYPRVLITRGEGDYGPFPKSSELRAALKMARQIFPFRDKCRPENKKPCFNYQIGLCPGVCAGEISETDYKKTIRHLKLFFSGKKKQLLRDLHREMKVLARSQRFEEAGKIKKQIFALQHIQDVSLIKPENISLEKNRGAIFRLEAYDVAHTSGQNAVGVMVVLEDGEPARDQYRKFKLRNDQKGNDLEALREILERRFNHPEWPFPNLIVIDGGKTQLKVAKKFFDNVVAVVKDDKHRAREILGDPSAGLRASEEAIIRANHEAHRFAISYHRQKRGKALF